LFKVIASALFAICFFIPLDQYLYFGRHTEAVVRMLQDIQRGLGL
jgi:hypothetical protein